MKSDKRSFITGVTGFVGQYLAAHLNERGFRVYGMDRLASCRCPGVDYHEGDILNTAALAQHFSSVRPDMIFHLAGVSLPSDADKSPIYALNVNIMGAVSVMDAALQTCASSKILLVGTSKQYGEAFSGAPVSESVPCAPASFYGLSKYAAELCGMQYVRQHGLDVRFTRSFNHTGPGQSEKFVCPDWARQAALIAHGKAGPVMRVGDIAPSIDFTDVRDVVRAYPLILDKGERGGVYNVCSGTAVPLKDILESITASTGKNIRVEQDPARLKKYTTPPIAVGDRSKITSSTGWEPRIPLSKTIEDLCRYWLDKVSRTEPSL